MNKPIPLTVNPDDPDSPKGAVPVDIHGIEGGGGTDIDWADIEAQDISLLGLNAVELHGGVAVDLSMEHNRLRLDETGTWLSSGTSDVNISVGSASRDIRFYSTVLVDGEYESHVITLREILGKIDELEQRLEALEP